MIDTQALASEKQALLEKLRALEAREKDAREKARQERQAHLNTVTTTIQKAGERLADSIRYFGGRVPVILTVGDNGEVKAETRSNPQVGQVVSSGARHGGVTVDGREYSSLNAAGSTLYPDAGKKGTVAWRAYLENKGHTVTFVDQ